jgi:hypothetical protein
MIKKLLTLSLIFIGALTLSACDPETGLTTEEILEQISEAVDELDLPSETSTDLTLPNTGVHDVVITWESSNEDYVSDSGMVTIPTKTEGNKSVTMTATLELEDQVLTKSFTVTVIAATDLNDAEKVAADTLNVFIPEGETFDDVTLPTAGANGTTVTWVSSHPAVISATGVVTRPASDAANVTVTMTATITLGSESQTKAFELIVVKQVDTIDIKDLKDGYDADPKTVNKGDLVVVKGVVVQTLTENNKGYFIYDTTGFIFVYTGSTDPTVAKGDVVLLEGEFDNYFGQSQIKNVSSTEVLTEVIAVPTPTVKTIADIIAYTTSPASALYGELIELTGNIVYDGTEYYYIQDEDGNKLELNDDSDIAPLIALVGKNVTVTIVYQTYHSGHGNHQLAFSGDAADVVENTLSEADALAADLATVQALFPEASLMDITLPTAGTNGTVYSNWTSSDTAVYTDAGVFVAQGVTSMTITFTATATNGSETGTATAEVVVPIAYTIDEVLEMSQGDFVVVTGIVYYFDAVQYGYDGFSIFTADGYIYIETDDYRDTLTLGDEVTLVAKVAGFYHDKMELVVFELTEVSDGNALPTVETVELGDVVAENVAIGALVTVTGKAIEVPDGDYTDLYLEDAAGNKIQVHYYSDVDAFDTFIDKVVTVEIQVYGSDYVWFTGTAADVTEVTAGFSETDQANAVASAIEIGLGDLDNVTSDLTLPLTYTDPTATVTWASDTVATIAADGTVVQTFGSNVMVTLTASVTVGSTTITKDIMVTVLDADMGTPLSVADAMLETLGDTILVTGVVTGFNYKDEPFIQDADGTAIFVDKDVAVEIGDLVVVRGDLEKYQPYNSDSRDHYRLYNVALVEIVSSDNAVFVITDGVPADIADPANILVYGSKTYTMDLTVDNIDDTFGYALFVGNGTTNVKIYRGDIPELDVLFEDGVNETFTFTFTVYDIHYDNVRLDNVTIALTDAEKQEVSEALLDIDLVLTEDLTLPATDDWGAVITWATSDALVITDAGVVTIPAIGQPDATATLTATIQVGSEVAVTKEFAITVEAEKAVIVWDHTENFSAFVGSGTSYVAETITGDSGFSFALTESRPIPSGYEIDTDGIMFRGGGDITAAAITGGIGSLSIDFRMGYTGGSPSDREITIKVNDVVVGTYVLTTTDTVENFLIENINVTGTFKLEIIASAANTRQICVNNVEWTEYSGS